MPRILKVKSGIYKIVNKINDKFYIGSAKNLMSRKNTHFQNLSKNIHHNKYLQNSYNKYGKENFEFIVIERCPTEDLISREQYYFNILNPVYNFCKVAGSVLGRKHSQETIEKIRRANTGHVASLEQRRNQSIAKLGMYKNKSKNVILQFDLFGNLIKKWYNGSGHIAEVLSHKGFKRSGISMCLVGKLKTYKKYIWQYEK